MNFDTVGRSEGFQKLFPKRPLYPKSVQKLIDIFMKFPGIGPRQATRFAFFVLHQNLTGDLLTSLQELKTNVAFCGQCYRSMEMESDRHNVCAFCRDSKRNPCIIAVIEKEADLQNLEKTSFYQGLYHLLGGIISPLDSDSPKRLHLKELYKRVAGLLEKYGKCEIVLATNSTTEGDTTALYIEQIIQPLKNNFPGLSISRLGRGLSLGSELEYADEITLKNALTNRK